MSASGALGVGLVHCEAYRGTRMRWNATGSNGMRFGALYVRRVCACNKQCYNMLLALQPAKMRAPKYSTSCGSSHFVKAMQCRKHSSPT